MEQSPAQSAETWQLRRLLALGEATAKKFAAVLSSLCDIEVAASVVEIAQLPYGALLAQLELPVFFCLLRAESVCERLTLDMQPAILEVMLDRLLGGKGVVEERAAGRTPTEIEASLVAHLVRRLVQQLERAWQALVEGKLFLAQIVDDPRPLRALPADEPIAVIVFQVALGNQVGEIRLGVPCRLLKRLEKSSSGSIAQKVQPESETSVASSPASSVVEVALPTGLPRSACLLPEANAVVATGAMPTNTAPVVQGDSALAAGNLTGGTSTIVSVTESCPALCE